MTEPQRFTIEITRPALQDLSEVATYRAEKRGDDEAAALLQAVRDRIADLQFFPYRGAEPKELRDLDRRGYRQVLLGRLRIVYVVESDRVSILLVADGRRDMQRLLRDRLLTRDPPG